ncbi:helix-turn-helix domain-containing protein [uncultured Dysosmobacter sp.]|uniref:helix-turn-helix domain-containing protein n=1 Tax=uncultured Dysosmobacter sp. TaxID=2591384 RepID=UPI002630DBCF|nr:helix-turn-helix transcriptional regulator [uncultured Dysosmobacter sp.]
MNREKTGGLIASARREKGLTQKELARALHVSDRAVSKWERGAGFPDVSLLEPLADALGLTVLDLLRGERRPEEDTDTAVREALDAFQEKQRLNQKEERQAKWLLCGLLAVMVAVLFLVGFLRIPIKHTALAGIYENGVQTSATEVQVEGSIRLSLSGPSYWGKFHLPLDRISMEPERRLRFKIPITSEGLAHAASRRWTDNIFKTDRPFIGNNFCLTFFMREFAFNMTDGRIVATSPAMYERYVETYDGTPLPNAK